MHTPKISLLLLFTLLSAGLAGGCDRQDPIDPDALARKAGVRAFKFYRTINEYNQAKAVKFFSPRLRQRLDDPLDHPLFVEQREGKYHKLIAQKARTDWRTREVIVPVTKHHGRKDKGGPAMLRSVGSEHHRWKRYDGEWYFDGIVGQDPQ